MTRRFVLVHGWGFNANLWDDFAPLLGDAEIVRVDLGFISGASGDSSSFPEDAIAIGHSLGTAWLLRQFAEGGGCPFRALVAIQGFDRFCPHVPRARLAGMRRGLKRDPAATLAAFWRACGVETFAPADALNPERLDEGLAWLTQWDLREAKAALACPVLALAARDDAIVSPSMSAAIWGDDNIRWSDWGGHVLPLSRPDWCARHVLDFAHDLDT
jgi:pimeloyl-[acyl-carrier protein] methyl ester esterase